MNMNYSNLEQRFWTSCAMLQKSIASLKLKSTMLHSMCMTQQTGSVFTMLISSLPSAYAGISATIGIVIG